MRRVDFSRWVPGSQIPDGQQEADRSVALTVEFKLYGTKAHVEKSVEVLNNLLETRGYRDHYIHVQSYGGVDGD